MNPAIHVLKFGSSVLESERELPRVVAEIYAHVRAGHRVVAVVSAFAGVTDELLARARALCARADESAIAALAATGECTSAALLAIALDESGIPATLLEPARAAPLTRGAPLAAEPIGVDVTALARALAARPVAIVAGFIGRDAESGATTLLGRGGSDLSAVLYADALGAERTVLYKDVDGLYDRDPNCDGALAPARYSHIASADALALGGGIVQPLALATAAQLGVRIEVAALATAIGTLVGADEVTTLAPRALSKNGAAAQPLRVTLLGHGTVGASLRRRLRLEPERYSITAILVRDTDRHASIDEPTVLTDDPDRALAIASDVVIEAQGGIEPARTLCRRALQSGRHVITANKALVATAGVELAALAKANNVTFAFSAAVGGAAPMLESVARAALAGHGLRSIEAVINGTVAFLLDRIASGATLAAALAAARDLGLAEADPSLDLDGIDAAQKLAILARVGFGEEVDWRAIPRASIHELDLDALAADRAAGWSTVQIATIKRTTTGLLAWVGFARVPRAHPLAQIEGVENALMVEPIGGASSFVRGKGAGGEPTSLAVFADLRDVAIERDRTFQIESGASRTAHRLNPRFEGSVV